MEKNNFICVISKEAFGEYSAHQIQASGAWTENPYGDAFALVPPEMVEAIMETHGFCDMELNGDGTEVVGFTARKKPEAPVITPAEQREAAYNTAKTIPWEGDNITVTEAAQLWQYYAAEGNPKAEELTALIAKAKTEIRERYPDN